MKKQKLLKVFIIVVASLAVLYLLTLALPLIYDMVKYRAPEVSIDYSETESTFDFGYQSLDRSIYYTVYGDTEVINPDCPDELGDEAEFFYRFMTSLIDGDADAYRACFTDGYLADNELPDRFACQKLYDVSVTLYSKSVEDNVANSIYIVRFKIYKNDGSLFNVNSDITYTTCFKLKNCLIDSVLEYKVK